MSETTGSNLPDRSPQVFAATTITLVLAGVFVVLRLISRGLVVKNVRWDDGWIVLAFLIAFGLSFAILYGTTKGLGKGDLDIQDDWRQSLRNCEYAFAILYVSAAVTFLLRTHGVSCNGMYLMAS